MTAQTYWTDSLTYFVDKQPVREGAFKALLEDPTDPTDKCYLSFLDVREIYDIVAEYKEKPKTLRNFSLWL